jgi:hypothetical protein
VTAPYSDEDFLLPDTIVVAKIPSIVFLVPRVGIITCNVCLTLSTGFSD